MQVDDVPIEDGRSSSRFQKYLITAVHVVCSGRTVLFLVMMQLPKLLI